MTAMDNTHERTWQTGRRNETQGGKHVNRKERQRHNQGNIRREGDRRHRDETVTGKEKYYINIKQSRPGLIQY